MPASPVTVFKTLSARDVCPLITVKSAAAKEVIPLLEVLAFSPAIVTVDPAADVSIPSPPAKVSV